METPARAVHREKIKNRVPISLWLVENSQRPIKIIERVAAGVDWLEKLSTSREARNHESKPQN